MKSLEDLKRMRSEVQKRMEMRETDKDYRVVVGMATCGISAGARPVLNKMVEIANAEHLPCTVSQTGCIGMCKYEPIVEVYDKNNEKTTYIYVNPEKAEKILREHVGKGHVIDEYTINSVKDERLG
ncbi:MAG: (2Fe-2S) ferredoxin domain-containing protein [Erysipelotrichaceae bacterium]|jgi:NADP-reducing hydrogenase subunit HndB|nr:(2Fe-2S) ferredoxin domain-containing protein [Erysipelotrichaceae bacterium]